MARHKQLAATAATVLDAPIVDAAAIGPRLGYKQAARYLGLKQGTLRVFVSRKQVPHIRISTRLVVFDRAALDAFLKARSVGGSR